MNAPQQFDIPIPDEPMRLVGETARQDEPPKRETPDTQTREFPGLRGTFFIHELPEARP